MTLAEIRTAIQQKGYGTDTATAQSSMTNSVYRRILNMRRWWFLDTFDNESITTTSGDGIYDLSGITDLQYPEAVRISQGANHYELEYLNPQKFRRDAHYNQDSGLPLYWTYAGSNLNLFPIPDGVYTLNIDYVKAPPALTADGDEPVGPDTLHDAIVWGVVRELCFRERDASGWSLANDEFTARINDLKHQDGLRQRQNGSQVGRSNEVEYVNVWYY